MALFERLIAGTLTANFVVLAASVAFFSTTVLAAIVRRAWKQRSDVDYLPSLQAKTGTTTTRS